MWKCNSHLRLAMATVASNTWLLTDDDGGKFLVDTGHAAERQLLRLALGRSGIRRPGDLQGILLTHRHTDHAGNAQWLKDRFGCPVFCHENDVPFLRGEEKPAPLKRGLGNPWDELLCGIEDWKPSRCDVDEAFGNGPWKFGFHIFNAYGHTEGSCLIYHEPTKTLFTGDSLLTGLPVIRFPRLGLAVEAYSIDVKACHRNTLQFLENPPQIRALCSGHGPFVNHNVKDKLNRFYQTKTA